jgi:hypothetical protein
MNSKAHLGQSISVPKHLLCRSAASPLGHQCMHINLRLRRRKQEIERWREKTGARVPSRTTGKLGPFGRSLGRFVHLSKSVGRLSTSVLKQTQPRISSRRPRPKKRGCACPIIAPSNHGVSSKKKDACISLHLWLGSSAIPPMASNAVKKRIRLGIDSVKLELRLSKVFQLLCCIHRDLVSRLP